MPTVGPNDPDIEFGAINMRRHLEAMELVSYLLSARCYVFVLVGLAITFLVILLFAGLFYACEPHCFNDLDEFTFERMMWVSAHTFTTMGNPYVRCGAGQFLVILENYAALLVQLLLGGVVLVKVITPRAKLRFAQNCVIPIFPAASSRWSASAKETDLGQRLLIRLANNTRYPLEHCTAQVRCMLDARKLPSKHRSKVSAQVRLPLDADSKAILSSGEHWVLAHSLDGASPLLIVSGVSAMRSAREAGKVGIPENGSCLGPVPGSERLPRRTSSATNERGFNAVDDFDAFDPADLDTAFKTIAWVDVMISAFDPVYDRQVRFNKRYFAKDIVSHADWEDMLVVETISTRDNGTPALVFVVNDHSKLDKYVELSESGSQRADKKIGQSGNPEYGVGSPSRRNLPGNVGRRVSVRRASILGGARLDVSSSTVKKRSLSLTRQLSGGLIRQLSCGAIIKERPSGGENGKPRALSLNPTSPGTAKTLAAEVQKS